MSRKSVSKPNEDNATETSTGDDHLEPQREIKTLDFTSGETGALYTITEKAGPFIGGKRSLGKGHKVKMSEKQAAHFVRTGEITKDK